MTISPASQPSLGTLEDRGIHPSRLHRMDLSFLSRRRKEEMGFPDLIAHKLFGPDILVIHMPILEHRPQRRHHARRAHHVVKR